MNNYKVDFLTNTITVSKAFELAANNPKSAEYKILTQIRADYPNMTVIRKTRRPTKTANPSKGLTYANMERYIMAYDNAAELLERFEQVKELAAAQVNSYHYVKSWFVSQFPNYKKLPDFTSLKLVANVVPAPIVAKDRAA